MITIERLRPDDHEVLHAWVAHPRSVFWGMPHATPEVVAAEYARVDADPHHHAWLGRVDGEPAFLTETYDPAHSELANLSELAPGDLGMHVLVAPPTEPRAGFTRAVFAAVMRFCFADAAVVRVVVEPDERNEKIARLNAAAGFVIAGPVDLGHKVAALSFCTRADFAASPLGAFR